MDNPEEGADRMDVNEAIQTRSSYRGRYAQTPVDREHLRQIMNAGLSAPSGCNMQTTELLAIDDAEQLDKLYALIDPPAMQRVPALICVLTRKIIAYNDRCFQVQDYAAAIENMLLQIVGLGYQSCWIEGRITDRDRICDKIAALLEVPPESELVGLLPVGRALDPLVRAKKKSFASRAWFNRYGGEPL